MSEDEVLTSTLGLNALRTLRKIADMPEDSGQRVTPENLIECIQAIAKKLHVLNQGVREAQVQARDAGLRATRAEKLLDDFIELRKGK